ncbi:MAG: ribose 5-phosphate isomerase B [Candidatus Margulisiibacteriota bacterium]
MPIKIIIGSDHGGYNLKKAIITHLKQHSIEAEDMGTTNADDSVDYPDFAVLVAKKVQADENTHGILICGTGIGMSISANKFKGIRAALCHNEVTAKMAREHNDANILVLGGRVLTIEYALIIVNKWLETPFSNEERHLRRLEKIKQIEECN